MSIESNRRALDERPDIRKWSSPALLGLVTTLESAIAKHAAGDVLDVGCGSMPYRELVLSVADAYDGLDIEARHEDVRYMTSATDMGPVPDDAYDTVLCSEVLEHVSQPTVALTQMRRVLKPGGRLILSVPFLGRLHEEPHDYFRYTEHGLRSMLEQTGFVATNILATGSVGSFLGHQVSTALVGTTYHLPVVKWIALCLNLALVVGPARLIDKPAILQRKLPLGYVVIASVQP